MAAAFRQSRWREHGLKPHLRKGFKVSKFKEKLRDSARASGGILVRPAFRPWTGRMKKGRAGTLTHDYKLHGTNLFAALNVHR